MKHITHVICLGEPKLFIETDIFNHLEVENFTYIDKLFELTPEGIEFDEAYLVNLLIHRAKAGELLYLATGALDREERSILKAIEERFPSFIHDEALEMLRAQLGGPLRDPIAFEDAVIEASMMGAGEKIVIGGNTDDTTLEFFAPGRLSSPHTIRWTSDAIEVDGAIMRHTAIMGVGHYKKALLGDRVLSPEEVLGFIATRLAVNGVEELLGYGRAFGPGKEDQTNATLSPRSRRFRAQGVVGVVKATLGAVSKSRPEMVTEVAELLHKQDSTQPIWLHQQCKEIYLGQEAAEAFRAKSDGSGKWTLWGKSTKHARVDAGAYCLYTAQGDGTLRVPALIGQFDVSNDGMIYAPKRLLDTVDGWLMETVKAVKDFSGMSPEMIAKYYNTVVLVEEEQVILPGEIVFEVDGVQHAWNTKADYGIVRKVVDEATEKLVRVIITIEAHFTGDIKIRGFGKGLVSTAEAAGITAQVYKGTQWVDCERFIIGAPGIIKDSEAAKSYMHNIRPVSATVTTSFCERNYALYKALHGPVDGYKRYGEDIEMKFFDDTHQVMITDHAAMTCDVDVMIEASPVGQSVGSSAMTLPQLSWLSHLPSGMEWIEEMVLPGIERRAQALAYLHRVANQL